MGRAPERWHLTIGETKHEVTIENAGWRRRISWHVDDAPVATKATSDEKVTLYAAGHGTVAVRLPAFVAPARRVALFDADSAAAATVAAWSGVGGRDLHPEPGSKAAARQEWIRTHPRAYTVRQTALAVAAVLLPLLALWLLPKLTIPWPDIPWPDLPRIPWPEIPWPEIPWPDLPRIPWPDWSLPEWVHDVLEKAKYVWPVLVAYVAARAEIRRRRRLAQHDPAGKPGSPEPGSSGTYRG